MEPVIHSLVIGFGHRMRHGKDTVAKAILDARGTPVFHGKMYEGAVEENMGRGTGTIDRPVYDIRSYSFAKELKDEVNALYECHATWYSVFLHLRTVGVPLKNGSSLLIPEWVVMESDPDMTDPLCPYGKYRSLLQWWGSEYRRNHFGENYWVERAAARIAKENPEIALFSDLRFPNEAKFVKEYGHTIKVNRPGLTSPNSHISEEALADYDGWDYVLTNDGSLDDLKGKAVMLFDHIMNEKR